MITGGLTVIFGGFVWLFFPDSPLTAKFLTYEERAQAILRIKENHSGIEQKVFKRYQSGLPRSSLSPPALSTLPWNVLLICRRFIEAIRDPKTWLFFLHAWSQEMANGTTNQMSLLINSFGFTVLQTTLLGAVTGACSFVCLITAAFALWKTNVGNPRLLSEMSVYVTD